MKFSLFTKVLSLVLFTLFVFTCEKNEMPSLEVAPPSFEQEKEEAKLLFLKVEKVLTSLDSRNVNLFDFQVGPELQNVISNEIETLFGETIQREDIASAALTYSANVSLEERKQLKRNLVETRTLLYKYEDLGYTTEETFKHLEEFRVTIHSSAQLPKEVISEFITESFFLEEVIKSNYFTHLSFVFGGNSVMLRGSVFGCILAVIKFAYYTGKLAALTAAVAACGPAAAACLAGALAALAANAYNISKAVSDMDKHCSSNGGGGDSILVVAEACGQYYADNYGGISGYVNLEDPISCEHWFGGTCLYSINSDICCCLEE